MEKIKKEKQVREEEKPLNIYNSRTYLRVGEVELGSDNFSPNQLCGLLVWLLKRKVVREYLDIFKFKTKLKMNTDMYG